MWHLCIPACYTVSKSEQEMYSCTGDVARMLFWTVLNAWPAVQYCLSLLSTSLSSPGQPDANAPQTIANARAAGIPYVDVYLFPCPTCTTSAGEQVREMVDSLSSSDYGQIWLDVEVCKCMQVYMHTCTCMCVYAISVHTICMITECSATHAQRSG